MHAARGREVKDTRLRIRDISIGGALFVATAAFCLWQNTRVAALFDLSYLLDTSWRISLGQLPYRDFPFAHAPGTFLLHALIIRICGRIYWPHVVCAALESGAATVLAWRLLLRLLQPFGGRAWWIAALLALTLAPLGIYSIYPHPIYDGDCILTVLIALYLTVRTAKRWENETAIAAGAWRDAIAGAACVVPVFFKQNIGLAFLAATVAAVTAIAAIRGMRRRPLASCLRFLGGVLAALTLAVLAIHATVGLRNYRYWTITFAAERRLPAMAALLGVYHQASLLWTIPAAIGGLALLRVKRLHNKRWAESVAFLLLVAPFLWTLIALIGTQDTDDRTDRLLALWPHLLLLASMLAVVQAMRWVHGRTPAAYALLPFLLLAVIHGAFLSQQLWGSTYALWPLLVLLIALLLFEVREIAALGAATIALTLLVCGGLYAASLERLEYIHREGAQTHAVLPALRGMTTPGSWLPEFEAMVRFTDREIPREDGIVLVPGEEPFYFATGRMPRFPVLLTDLATDPYTPEETVSEMRARNIRWLIVKRDLQLMAPPDYETPELLREVEADFSLYRSLPGYDVYRRK